MAISEEEVKHVAKLSKLAFEDNEIHQFTVQFSEILDMIDQLSEVDTTGIEVMVRGTDVIDVMREDVSVPGTDRGLLFRNVKTAKDGYIEVPTIIDGGEGNA